MLVYIIMDNVQYKLIVANSSWADAYRHFCQRAYQANYTHPELGLSADLFSNYIFDHLVIRSYFKDMVRNDKSHGCWLAVRDKDDIVGGVAAHKHAGVCTMKMFYVEPALKGQGIGKQLFQQVLEFAGNLPIEVDVVQFMHQTIGMYKRWGFTIDKHKTPVNYKGDHWPAGSTEAFWGVAMLRKPTRQ